MTRIAGCLFQAKLGECPIGANSCAGCPWLPAEDRRRRALPLARDPETGLYRKIVCKKKKEEEET